MFKRHWFIPRGCYFVLKCSLHLIWLPQSLDSYFSIQGGSYQFFKIGDYYPLLLYPDKLSDVYISFLISLTETKNPKRKFNLWTSFFLFICHLTALLKFWGLLNDFLLQSKLHLFIHFQSICYLYFSAIYVGVSVAP